MTDIAYILGPTAFTVVIRGEVFEIGNDHPKFNDILDVIRNAPENETAEQNFDRAELLLSLVKQDSANAFTNQLEELGIEDITVENGQVLVRGEPMHTHLTDRILELQKARLPFEFLLKFWVNLSANPDEHPRQNLFKFLDSCRFPLTDDGCFLGYKFGKYNDEGQIVDWYSGTTVLEPGAKVPMKREDVVADPKEPCAPGLHIGTLNYAKGIGANNPMVVVKVNPKDVVSIPNEYRFQKLRSCYYEVVNVFRGTVKTSKQFVRPAYKEEEYSSETWEDEEDVYEVTMGEPEDARRERYSAMSRDEVCRIAASEGVFLSTNEARDLGKDVVVESMVAGIFPYQNCPKSAMVKLALRRKMFTSPRKAQRTPAETLSQLIKDSTREVRNQTLESESEG
tara:strand:+ start:30444 stop:31631 length:1188 start_codon:yes stop_codon:yes gene_type:complete